MTAPAPWRVQAFNTATTSTNKIHDDEVARSYGFAGGLVPGVDVYAYLTHAPVEHWGIAFLERGALAARFHHPVYDGDEITVEASVDDDGALALTLFDPRGETCATASASLPSSPPGMPALDAFEAWPMPVDRPPAAPQFFAGRPQLGSLEFGFHADHAATYLHEVRETLPLYEDECVAHPGWLLRSANSVLVSNARLGPWIHVSSTVQHYRLVHDGDEVSTRARVVDDFERKGHKFVALDVLVIANFTTPVMRVLHTAIYEPRQLS